MIRVEMHGRLGNQLFQYAAARALQNKNKEEMIISFRQINGANTEGNRGWENSLKYFNVAPFKVYEGNKSLLSTMPLTTQWLCLAYAISYRPLMKNFTKWNSYQQKWAPLLDKVGVRWIANGYFDFKNDYNSEYLLNGSFEALEYFNDIRDVLLNEITPKYEELEQNRDLYDVIRSTNSVCLSLRHFQLKGQRADNYDVCGLDYYLSAIEQIKQNVDSPVFIVFSDDLVWAKEMLKLDGDNVYYETSDNPIWEKLRLMYSCNHFIIPNSTFAWWAQYLGKYDNKVVVSPSKWFNSDFDSPLISPSWIRLDKNGSRIN
jgi:hypothetical protein